MQRKCTKCFDIKDINSFHSRGNGKYQSWCKQCHGKYTREENRKIIYNERKKSLSKIRRDVARKFMWDFLSKNPCMDCGESDPIVLGFDHREDKYRELSKMTQFSIENIKKEISKCDIRCANCHRRKTSKDLGWYSDLL